MNLDDVFESVELSMRKTVWSKRGETITRKHVDEIAPTDIQPRTKIEIKDTPING